MTDALFDIGPSEDPIQGEILSHQRIRDYQVVAIREAFTSAGIESQERRQKIAQSCVVRPLSSLRELSAAEAHRVMKRIKDIVSSKPQATGASAWDLRDEDTWIDKL